MAMKKLYLYKVVLFILKFLILLNLGILFFFFLLLMRGLSELGREAMNFYSNLSIVLLLVLGIFYELVKKRLKEGE